jgi:hypothetical protein
MSKQKETAAKKDDWMQTKWRPMMAMMYMAVCAFDFVVAPILWAVVQFWEVESANDAFRQWQPLTLQGAGLFHMAMGAVLGITAYGRTQEKMKGSAENALGGLPMPGSAGGGFGTPAPAPMTPSSAPAPAPRSFGGGGGFSAPSPDTSFGNTATVTIGFGGKKAPPEPDFYPER